MNSNTDCHGVLYEQLMRVSVSEMKKNSIFDDFSRTAMCIYLFVHLTDNRLLYAIEYHRHALTRHHADEAMGVRSAIRTYTRTG